MIVSARTNMKYLTHSRCLVTMVITDEVHFLKLMSFRRLAPGQSLWETPAHNISSPSAPRERPTCKGQMA